MSGVKVYGVLLQDRETGKAYALHDACAAVMHDTVPHRFVDMGPGSLDGSDVCNLAACGKRLDA